MASTVWPHWRLHIRPGESQIRVDDVTDRVCRLYLIVPGRADAGFADRFSQALDAGDVACVAMQPGADGRIDRALAQGLMSVAHANGVPFLFAGDLAAARALAADGLHMAADEALYAQARRTLGSDAIIGAECGLSRHDAMVMAQQGADYVAFGAGPGARRGPGRGSTLDLVAWWAELVEVPCVAWDLASVAAMRAAAGAGADFVALGEPVWRHPQGPAAGVREILAALDQALDAA